MSASLSLPRLNVANADFVTAQLAVGGDIDWSDHLRAVEEAVDLVVVGGITHVLDVRGEIVDELVWEETEVTYRWHGIDDAGQRIPFAWFDDIVGWAMVVLEDPGARLLTHCHMGINRGPSAGYAILLAQGWDPVEAIDAIRRARPVANVWYAEDALAWWHDRSRAGDVVRGEDRRRLRAWREQHPIDVVRIIAQARHDRG